MCSTPVSHGQESEPIESGQLKTGIKPMVRFSSSVVKNLLLNLLIAA